MQSPHKTNMMGEKEFWFERRRKKQKKTEE
jgi:hypothetical protein